MATEVETLEKLERRITITLPLADVQAEVEKQLKLRARTAKAPGFRPGSSMAFFMATMSWQEASLLSLTAMPGSPT